MDASILNIIRLYLGGEASLEDLRSWLALNQWQLPADEEVLADEADVALAHLDDGYADEEALRSRLWAALVRLSWTTVPFHLSAPGRYVVYQTTGRPESASMAADSIAKFAIPA